MITFIKKHWLTLFSLATALTIILWVTSCESTERSPIDPARKLTLRELNIELEHLISKYEYSGEKIREKEQIRKMILDNALIIAEQGTFNPVGLITAFLSIYGAASATRDVKNVVKPKKVTNSA